MTREDIQTNKTHTERRDTRTYTSQQYIQRKRHMNIQANNTHRGRYTNQRDTYRGRDTIPHTNQ